MREWHFVCYSNGSRSHVAILEKQKCDKRGEFNPGHRGHSDEVTDKEAQASDKFRCTREQRT